MAVSDICSIEGCIKPRARREWCHAHYSKVLAYGDPLGVSPGYRGPALTYFQDVVLAYDGDECLPWPFGRSTSGYGRVAIKGRAHQASRLVCEHVHGPAPTPKHHAAHLCGKGHEGCVTGRHLVWKTLTENEADKIVHGTVLRGEKCVLTKITEQQARLVLALKGKLLQREIGDLVGLTQQGISSIHRGQAWDWLREERAP